MDLASALAAEVGRVDSPALRAAAEALRDVYRSGSAPTTLALSSPTAALAYAAYRMPATYAAVQASLAMAAPSLAGLPSPTTHLDLGGGTGAAVWGAATRWPQIRSHVLDASRVALDLGARLAARGEDGLPSTGWEHTRFTSTTTLPRVDFVSISYLLGELDDDTAARLIDQSLQGSSLVLVLEPGTPRGHAAVLAARTRIIDAGWSLLAPCPHALDCPARSPDWCHFPVRLTRSSLHRTLKGGERGFEDEKYSFVLASRVDAATGVSARVVRHPIQRKGLVQLRTCEADGQLHDRVISRRQGETYKRARDLAWGDGLD